MGTQEQNDRSINILPGIIIVAVQLAIRFLLPLIEPDMLMLSMMSGPLGAVALIVWWCFFSRAPVIERIIAPIAAIASLVLVSFFVDISIATANMGLMLIFFSTPFMSLAFVTWAVIGSRMDAIPRRILLAAAVCAASLPWLFLRTDGMDGSANQFINWRWAPTAEGRMLASGEEASIRASGGIIHWHGFRGENRDSIVRGVSIATNWQTEAPKLLWKRSVGPGCSSFSARGSMFYTQEQQGEYEVVSCYDIKSGRPVWKHRDKARFYDSHAGAGPRATPTLNGGRLYSLGATGILNALDADSGRVLWTRNAAADHSVTNLMWGFSASPLVVGDTVVIALSGKLAAYSAKDGSTLWSLPNGGNSYSSPQLITVFGIPQIVHISMAGAQSVDPATGKQIWKYAWKLEDRILQPGFIVPSDFLISSDGEQSLRRVHVSRSNGAWAAADVWSSTEMKLNFNDFIIHKGHAYGFHGPSIACIDIGTGKRRWKGERYRGFSLLLADQDVLIILTEKGEIALVDAKPDGFREIAKLPAISGKTWSHPALAGDVLLVRNAHEMAAYRLALR